MYVCLSTVIGEPGPGERALPRPVTEEEPSQEAEGPVPTTELYKMSMVPTSDWGGAEPSQEAERRARPVTEEEPSRAKRPRAGRVPGRMLSEGAA